MTYLLDVNVLVALIDPRHTHHDTAHDWFVSTGRAAWATCAITENGLMRIAGHPRYPGSPGTPATVAYSLRVMRALPGHRFWACDISLLDPAHVTLPQFTKAADLTDIYLLALAKSNGGQLATFDRRMFSAAIVDGGASLHILPSPPIAQTDR